MVSAETQPTGEKNGMGRHLLVDEKGVPLGLVLSAANRHDLSQLEAVLNSKIAHQHKPRAIQENLCADAGQERATPGRKTNTVLTKGRKIVA